MRYQLLVPMLPLLALFMQPHGVVGQTTGVSYVKVSPIEGHPGSTFYLTGGNLLPNQQDTVTIACPYIMPGADIETKGGVKTDAHGRFIRFSMQAITPTFPGPKAQAICTLYVSDGANPFGPVIPAKYIIRPPGMKLDSCAAHICGVRVKVAPITARAGQFEKIVVNDALWPGAKATIGLRYGQQQSQFRSVRLDYNGAASVLWPVHVRLPASASSLKATVSVRLQLGVISGKGQKSFTVVH
ncbi:MAG: hypothetical protein M3Z66_25415 [Chloroflexota bacterium]|nr:hypothetical protein [Chloroflexota bacterium]